MNTKFVETFLQLAEVKSVRQVARQMHTTPGTVSMRIKKLEEQVGVTLFNWNHKTLEITPKGAQLISYAQAIMEATNAFKNASSTKTRTSKLRLGVNESIVLTVLPKIMRFLERLVPGIQIDLSVDLTTNLKERLILRELDIIMHVSGDQTATPFFSSYDILEFPQHWISKPRSLGVDLPLDQLLSKQFITQMRGTVPYELALDTLRQLSEKYGLPASDIRVSGSPSLAAMISLVKGGIGIGIMPAILVKKELLEGELIELNHPTIPATKVSLSHMRNASPAICSTADLINKICAHYCRKESRHYIRFVGDKSAIQYKPY